MSAPVTLVQITRPAGRPKAMVSLTIDGHGVSVPEGTSILTAAAELGVTIPTLCYLETLRPVNVCWLCVVEVAGARVLVPAAPGQSNPGWSCSRDRPGSCSRWPVLELLASSVDLSTAPGMADC